jgi:hypothetical protein
MILGRLIPVGLQAFEEMSKHIETANMSERKRVCSTVWYGHTEYVITSAMGGGADWPTDWRYLYASRCVDLNRYTGTLKPLSPDELYEAYKKGERERGYEGQMLPYRGRTLVLCEEVTFEVSKENYVQLSLF